MNDDHKDESLLQDLGKHARDRQTGAALEPLAEDFQRRMTRQIKDAVQTAAPEIAPPAPAKVMRGPWLALAASVLAAVGLTVGLMSQPPVAALPDYTVEFRGGAQMRSVTGAAPIQFSDRLDVVLRPAIATDETVTIEVFSRQEGNWVRLPVNVQWAASGSARIQAKLDETLGLRPGVQDFAFVIARDDTFPGTAAIDSGTPSTDWQVLRQQFELVP